MQFTFKSRGWGVVKRAFPLNYLCFAEFRFAARGGGAGKKSPTNVRSSMRPM